MSDHDRGAYTPQPDAPLQFDARGPRARRPMPMTLIGSGAVLVVLLGALALHYQHDTTAEAPRPVGEPLTQVKTAAPADAQPKDPAAGVDVFNTKAPATEAAKAPTFAPPPEPPKPRPQLQVQALETIPTTRPTPAASAQSPPPAQTPPLAQTPVQTPAQTQVPAQAAPAPVNGGLAKPALPKAELPKAALPKAALPAGTPTKVAGGYKAPTPASIRPDATSVVEKVAGEPARPAVPAVKAAAKAAAPAAPATGGGAVVQIGAFSSTAQSEKGWADVSTAMSGQMSGKAKRVEVLAKDGKPLYRTSVVGFPSRAAADAFCKALAAKGKTCFVKS